MDFFKFLFHNSYTQLGLHAIVIIFLYIIIEDKVLSSYSDALFLFVALTLGIAILQTALLFANKKLFAYKDLTKLLLITKKIEQELESYGGLGKGVYEKAKSLSQYLPQEILDALFSIAESRNRAIHADPKIDNSHEVINKAKKVHKVLTKMSSKKYLLFMWTARTLMFTLVALLGFIFVQKFHLGLAILLTLIAYYVNFFFMQRVGHKSYLIFFFSLAAALIAFLYTSKGNLNFLEEFVRYVF